MPKKYFKPLKILACGLILCTSSITLSGCASELEGHSIKLEQHSNQPIHVNTYTNDGQKIDDIQTNQVKIKDDNKLDPAIDIFYGQNKIIHTGSSLITYEGLHNYMDDYRHLQTKTATQDVTRDKSVATAATIYQNFHDDIKNIEHRNIIFVKSQTGTPIGVFVGSNIKVKEVGSTDFSNSIITIDNHQLFVYDCAYTIYPTSALKATGQNKKAPRTQKQDTVKTSSSYAVTPQTNIKTTSKTKK